jgi:hypothetical protein
MLVLDKEVTTQGKNQLLEVIDHHIKLTVEAIYTGMFAGPSPASVSFRHILSRIMILLQEPVTFVLFKTNELGDRQEVYRANKHRRHKKYIDEKIAQAIDSHSQVQSFFFDVFGMGYELLCLIAEADKQGRYQFNPLVVRSENPALLRWEIASYKLRKILEIEPFLIYKKRFATDLLGTLQRCADHEKSDTEADEIGSREGQLEDFYHPDYDQARLDGYNQFVQDLSRNTSEYSQLSQYGVIDKVFSKLKDNLLAIAAGGFRPPDSDSEVDERLPLTNFILFARDYSEPIRRHGGDYDYQLRLIVCSRQETEWRHAFAHWKEFPHAISRESYLKLFDLPVQASSQEEVQLIRQTAKRVNEYFWRFIDDGNIDAIIKVLKAPLSSSARSMADPVFDGVSYFRDPFSEGGIKRCFAPTDDFKEDLKRQLQTLNSQSFDQQSSSWSDVLRVVACHYLFDAMTDPTTDKSQRASKSDRLRIMLNPIEVGGRVWGVIGYLTQNYEIDPNAQNKDLIAFDLYWRQNYHVYQDVNSRVKKNLRVDFLRLYEQTVSQTVTQMLEESIVHNKAYGRVNSQVFQELINHRLSALTCYFPYSSVKITFRKVFGPEDSPEPHGTLDQVTSRRFAISGDKGDGTYGEYSSVFNLCYPEPPAMKVGAGEKFINLTNLAVETSNLVRYMMYKVGRTRERASKVSRTQADKE